MKKFCLKLSLLLGLLIVTAIINYYIDPGKKYMYYIFSTNKNILVLGNIDERVLKSKFIEKDKGKKEIVILGSSRVMTLSLNNSKVINLGVSGANLKDDLALLYKYIEENKKNPKKIIIGIDPWIFNKNEDTRYKVLENEYFNMLELLKEKQIERKKINERVEKIKYLFKISTLKDSIKILKRSGISKTISFMETEQKIDEKGNIYNYFDRSYQYSKKFIENKNIDLESYKNYQIENFSKLDEERKKELELFIQWCNVNKIDLLVYLPPYNPEHYKKYILNTKYKLLFDEIEIYMYYLKKKYNFELIGKYYRENLKNEDFYDSIHLRSEKINKEFFK